MPALAETILWGLVPLETGGAAGAPFAHDRTLMAVSMLIAVAGAFACLELAGRARDRGGAPGLWWLGLGGALLGADIWATHLVGMLAFESPLAHGLAPTPTAISAAAGIACGAAAFMIGGASSNMMRFLLASFCLGAGSIVMHYLGMRGLRIEAELTYRPEWVGVTTFGAFVCSMIAFRLAQVLTHTWQRAAAAFPIGAGAATLHYTDMAATVITPRPAFAAPAPQTSELLLGSIVAGVFAACVLVSLLAVWQDRQRMERAGAASDDDENIVVIPTSSTASADTVVLPLKSERRR